MNKRWVTTAVLAALVGCAETSTPPPAEVAATTPEVETPPPTPPPSRPMPDELQRAIALIEQGRFDDARALAAPFLKTNEDDPQATFVHGLTYHRARDYAAAEPLLARAANLDPSYAVVHHFLGYCRFHLGDLRGARTSFETHLRSVPNESDSHFGVGLVDLEEGRLDDAEKRFRHVIDLVERTRLSNPPLYQRRQRDIAKSYARLGDIAFAREQYAEARDLVRRAIGIDPNQYASYYTLSQIERRLGNDDEADRMQSLFDQMAAARHGRPPRKTDQ